MADIGECGRDGKPIWASVRRIMISIIANEPEPSTQKGMIMLAHGNGLLSDFETATMIASYGLRHA